MQENFEKEKRCNMPFAKNEHFQKNLKLLTVVKIDTALFIASVYV